MFRGIKKIFKRRNISALLRSDSANKRDVLKDLYRRNILIVSLQGIISFFLVMRLSFLQIFRHKKYKELSNQNQYRYSVLISDRGEIYDRNDKFLAYDKKYYSAVYVAKNLKKLEFVINKFVKILDKPISDLDFYKRNIIRYHKKYPNIPILLKNFLSREEIARLLFYSNEFKDIAVIKNKNRIYPLNEVSLHILGYISSSVDEKKQDALSKKIIYHPKFRTGKIGIEKSLNDYLSGKVGFALEKVDASDSVIESRIYKEPVKGGDLKLTIDGKIQEFVYQSLKGIDGSIVVMDIKNGGIIASVSKPSFDPNIISKGNVDGKIDNDVWSEINKRKQVFTNKAFNKAYPPGSVFKAVSALCALKDKVIDPNANFYCTGKYRVGRKTLHCHVEHGHGNVNMRTAIARSCNSYFYHLGTLIDIKSLHSLATILGFGESINLVNMELNAGIMPNVDWHRKRNSARWTMGNTVNTAIGQGFLESTPMQLAVMMSRIFSGKKTYPRLLMKDEKDLFFEDLDIDIDDLNFVKKALLSVFTDPQGTSRYYYNKDPRFRLAGKTGTAQVVSKRIKRSDVMKGNYRKDELAHLLFCGCAPFDNPRFAVATVLENSFGLGFSPTNISKQVIEFVINNSTS